MWHSELLNSFKFWFGTSMHTVTLTFCLLMRTAPGVRYICFWRRCLEERSEVRTRHPLLRRTTAAPTLWTARSRPRLWRRFSIRVGREPFAQVRVCVCVCVCVCARSSISRFFLRHLLPPHDVYLVQSKYITFAPHVHSDIC